MDDMDEEFLRQLRRTRRYASHWSWPDRGLAEKGVVEELLNGIAGQEGLHFSGLRSVKPDPPDCIAYDQNGDLLGFECTELVSQEAAQLNEQGCRVYREWDAADVIEEIVRRIQDRDLRQFNGGPYAKRILVICTDEPWIFSLREEMFAALEAHAFPQASQFDEVYFILSYVPNGDTPNPYVRLRQGQ